MPAKSAKVEFVQFHRPALPDGTYSVEVEQTIRTVKTKKIAYTKPISKAVHAFAVRGPEFSLSPQDVYAVFPPEGSLGEHSNVLPHVSLRRSTLPWERFGNPDDETSSWLALLVFHENERLGGTVDKASFIKRFAQGESLWAHLHARTVAWLERMDGERSYILAADHRRQSVLGDEFADLAGQVEAFLDKFRSPTTVSVGSLRKPATGRVRWPGVTLQPGADTSAKAKIIDVPVSLMRRIAPSGSDVGYLTHVRQEILFTSRANFESGLAGSTPTGRVIQVFGRNGFELDRQASVTVEEEGERWRIEDPVNGRGFIVRKDQGEYHVTDAARDELAVIMANRLPLAGGTSIAHLVSVAGRYGDNGFDYGDAGDGHFVRLVSLKSWRFSCVDDKQSFKALLLHLNHQLLFRLDGWGAGRRQEWLSESRQITAGLAKGEIPAVLSRAFDEKKATLSQDAAVEACQRRIADSHTTYFIGDQGTVFSASGRPLFRLRSNAANATKVTAELRQAFSDNKHPFSRKRRPVMKPWADRWWIRDGTRLYYVTSAADFIDVFAIDPDASSALRMPPLDQPDAEAYAAGGYLPLPHTLRQGGATFSWYHGPLAPGEVVEPGRDLLPARAADELLRYDTSNGLIDVSYAAAWELGRLLALKNKGFSTSLFKWKRTHRQTFRRVEQAVLHAHPHHLGEASPLLPDIPENVQTWFTRLRELRGVPFPYLVPDERMLPKESIRFFQVDPFWIQALQDGAFSIGRVLHGDRGHDRDHPAHRGSENGVSGFLLRSEVVSGWPGLLVDGYKIDPSQLPADDPLADPNRQPLPEDDRCKLIRMDRLSKQVLICLFDGLVKTVDIHLKPETLHFGLERATKPGTFQKELRDPDGEETDIVVDVDVTDDQVVKIGALADRIASTTDVGSRFSSFTSAQFALELTEGVERVRFIKRPS